MVVYTVPTPLSSVVAILCRVTIVVTILCHVTVILHCPYVIVICCLHPMLSLHRRCHVVCGLVVVVVCGC